MRVAAFFSESLVFSGDGMRTGAEGFGTSDLCDELSIWNVGDELFSILTETSPFERFLIVMPMQVDAINIVTAIPEPMMGHLTYSSKLGCSIVTSDFFWTSGRMNFVLLTISSSKFVSTIFIL